MTFTCPLFWLCLHTSFPCQFFLGAKGCSLAKFLECSNTEVVFSYSIKAAAAWACVVKLGGWEHGGVKAGRVQACFLSAVLFLVRHILVLEGDWKLLLICSSWPCPCGVPSVLQSPFFQFASLKSIIQQSLSLSLRKHAALNMGENGMYAMHTGCVVSFVYSNAKWRNKLCMYQSWTEWN